MNKTNYRQKVCNIKDNGQIINKNQRNRRRIKRKTQERASQQAETMAEIRQLAGQGLKSFSEKTTSSITSFAGNELKVTTNNFLAPAEFVLIELLLVH